MLSSVGLPAGRQWYRTWARTGLHTLTAATNAPWHGPSTIPSTCGAIPTSKSQQPASPASPINLTAAASSNQQVQPQQLRRQSAKHRHQTADVVQPGTSAGSKEQLDVQPPASPHLPVLLQEVLNSFAGIKLQVYVDGTLGAGGHASALLEAHPEMCTLAGIDVDDMAHRAARARLEACAPRSNLKVHLLKGNYCDVEQLLGAVPGEPLHGCVDGMLMDLGVSSMQFDTAERGFSLMRDGPLDMRMDPGAGQSAEELINTLPEVELARIIRDYGEEKLWKTVARRIAHRREAAPIRTTQQLVEAIGYTTLQSKGGRRPGRGIHPATRTFQALRIAVNDELGKLEKALPSALSVLAPGGRLAVISFHSLEDRLVKHAFMRACGQATPEEEHLTRGSNFDFLDALEARAVAKKVTRKPLTASEEELQVNPRARSAKLRVVQKL